MYSSHNQTNNHNQLDTFVVNALSSNPVGTLSHKALMSLKASAKRYGFDTLGDDELRLWIVDMGLGRLKRSTMTMYFNRLHVLSRSWYDFSKSDPFENVRGDLYRDETAKIDEAIENLEIVRRSLTQQSATNRDDGENEIFDIFLYLLYDVNATIYNAINFTFDEAVGKLPQIEDISDKYKATKRTKYVFGLQQRQARDSQITREITSKLTTQLSDLGLKFSAPLSRDTINAIWVAAALRSGISAIEIRSVVDIVPQAYRLLELIKPISLTPTRKTEILQKVADHINDNKKYWYVMQLRPGKTPQDVKRKLETKGYSLLNEICFYYPSHTIMQKNGRKKLQQKTVPYLPGVLFFYLRRNDVAPLFSKYIGAEAWCFRYTNRADSPYSAISRTEMEQFQRYVGEFTDDIRLEMVTRDQAFPIDELVKVYGGAMDGRICRITAVDNKDDKREYTLALAENVVVRWVVKSVEALRLEPLTQAEKIAFEKENR